MLKTILTVGLLSATFSAGALANDQYENKGLSTTCSDTNTWELSTGSSAKGLRLDFVGRTSYYGTDLAFSMHLDTSAENKLVGKFTPLYSTTGPIHVENVTADSFTIRPEGTGSHLELLVTQTSSGLVVTHNTPGQWAQGCFTTLTW